MMKALFLVLLTTSLATAQTLIWTSVQPGVWKAIVGKPETYNLLTASGVSPNSTALTKLGDTPFSLPKATITARIVDGKTYLRIPLKEFLRIMLAKGVRANLWFNPYVSPSASIFKAIQPFTASHPVWTGQIPDLTLPQARQLLFGQLAKDGVDIINKVC